MGASAPRRPKSWTRVKDKTTGHKFSVPTSVVDEERYQTLKQDAVDGAGNPLPAEHATASTTASVDTDEKKEGRGAAKNEGEGK